MYKFEFGWTILLYTTSHPLVRAPATSKHPPQDILYFQNSTKRQKEISMKCSFFAFSKIQNLSLYYEGRFVRHRYPHQRVTRVCHWKLLAKPASIFLCVYCMCAMVSLLQRKIEKVQISSVFVRFSLDFHVVAMGHSLNSLWWYWSFTANYLIVLSVIWFWPIFDFLLCRTSSSNNGQIWLIWS